MKVNTVKKIKVQKADYQLRTVCLRLYRNPISYIHFSETEPAPSFPITS